MSIKILTTINPKAIISVGMDVCKSKIDYCFSSKEKDYYITVKNNKVSLIKMIKEMKKMKFSKKIPLIIESTWDYNTLACILFSKEKYNIKEINPIITRNYIKHSIRWTKTDKTDSKALAQIWIINWNDFFTFSKDSSFIKALKKLSLIATLEKHIQALKRTIKAYYNTCDNLELEISNEELELNIAVRLLEKKIKNLQDEITNISLGEFNDKAIKQITSITGFSKYIATSVYISFAHKQFDSKESMYAFTWYDPKLRESWSYAWKAHISKRWNPYIRKKLFQAAFWWTRHSSLFKSIYDRAKERWKHHFVATNCVIKKMVHIIFSLLKNNTTFDPNFLNS